MSLKNCASYVWPLWRKNCQCPVFRDRLLFLAGEGVEDIWEGVSKSYLQKERGKNILGRGYKTSQR